MSPIPALNEVTTSLFTKTLRASALRILIKAPFPNFPFAEISPVTPTVCPETSTPIVCACVCVGACTLCGWGCACACACHPHDSQHIASCINISADYKLHYKYCITLKDTKVISLRFLHETHTILDKQPVTHYALIL